MNSQRLHKRIITFLVTTILLSIFLVGMLLEYHSLRPLLSGITPGRTAGREIILGHIAANLIMAWALFRLLPAKYRTSVLQSVVYYFLLGFFIPIFGGIGLLLVHFLGIRREKASDHGDKIWRTTDQPLMPNRARDIQQNTKFDDHGMRSRLRKSANIGDHLSIVLATRFMRDENAVPLLNIALKSPEDDVRLLAFSLLEKKNADINRRIEELRQDLTRENNKTKIHIAIAKNYLRLTVLGLIQDEMKTQALDKACEHLREALNATPDDRNAHFILGQVLLERGEIDQAQATLTKALEHGFAPGDVYPFLARLAHLRKDFSNIPRYIKNIPIEQRIYPPLADIAAYWLRHDNVNQPHPRV